MAARLASTSAMALVPPRRSRAAAATMVSRGALASRVSFL
jgi:hypothetical protein